MQSLRGLNAILTGASRGLGVDIARALADEGINLALAARSAEGLEGVRSDVAGRGVKAIAVPTDVADRDQLARLVETAERELGPTDILVNNAGIEAVHAYQDYPVDDIVQLMEVNLVAPMVLTRLVLGGMLERGRGHIVNVSSLAGKAGVPCQAPYGASKAGLIGFTQSLRAELVDTPIGCSAVCPGFVAETGMYADVVGSTGIRAPRIMGTSKPKKVADAVLKAIRRNPSELIVNPSPMRPLLALAQVLPDANARIHKALGITDMARRTAAAMKDG